MSGWWIKLMRHARPPARSLAAISALLLAVSALEALKPWPIKLLVDGVLKPEAGVAAGQAWLGALPGVAGSTAVLVAWLASAGVLLYGAAQLARVTLNYVRTGLGSRIAYALGGELLERLQELSLIFHTRQRVGDLVRRVVTDSGCVRDLVCGVLIPAAGALATLAIMFIIMLRLDPLLCVIAICFAGPLALLIRVFSSSMADRSYRQQELEGQVQSLAEQTLTSLPVVQTFSREAEHDRQFRRLADSTIAACLRTIASQLRFKLATGAVTAVGTAAVMVIGGMHVLEGKLTVGEPLVFIAYLASLYAPMETLAYLSMGYASASASARRVLEVLESGERVTEQSSAKVLKIPAEAGGLPLGFEHISFGYDRSRGSVLEGIDLDIPAGQVVALVGRTGAGKSTLASLVPRLYDPWEGRVLVGGADVRELTLASLRQQIAVVPQEPLLLPLSIAENIAYARPGAGRAEIVRAAEAAGAAEFIDRLPQGYATVLGEQGARLSAGQRQRLSIARALLKDSPLLILDEPTSALDAATERGIVDALARLLRGRTCLIIAHRLSTVRFADRIIVLERGQIAEDGSHEQLIERIDGAYRRLYELQIGGSVRGPASVSAGMRSVATEMGAT